MQIQFLTRNRIRHIFLGIIFLLSGTLIFSPRSAAAESAATDTTFQAQVIEVLRQQIVTQEDGSEVLEQRIKLKGLEGNWKNQEVVYENSSLQVITQNEYHRGDKVLVNLAQDAEGKDVFYIIDFVRHRSLLILALVFVAAVLLIGRLKGLRALVVLLLTFLIIIKFIIPRIMAGSSPLLMSILGAAVILVLAIYITEGFKRSSSVAILSMLISLTTTGLLAVWFTQFAQLTGFESDEAMFLVELAGGVLNIKGLLLAGIIIGTLGVLDDVTISQVVLVEELRKTNPLLGKRQLYSRAMKVGISHLSSMVNTLFLAYAGAALPLLIIFTINEPPFTTFTQVINNEMIATEIVRTLTGSIGLILAVPLSSVLAVQLLASKRKSVIKK